MTEASTRSRIAGAGHGQWIFNSATTGQFSTLRDAPPADRPRIGKRQSMHCRGSWNAKRINIRSSAEAINFIAP
jgi:hypothetical protein